MSLKPLPMTTRAYDRVVATTCSNMCEAACGMLIYVKDNRVVDIWGDPDNPINKGALCPKGSGAFQHIYNPLRVKYPMIRKTLDDDFKRVSWDDALDFVTERLLKLRAEYGPEAFMIHRTGRSDFLWKMGGARFGRLFGTPNVVGQGPICTEAPGIALNYVFGSKDLGRLTNPNTDWPNTRCMLIAGANISNNHPVEMQFVLEAKERGAKIIVIDPRFNTTAIKADIYMRLRPNTDAALVMAMVNVILKEDLYNHAFVEKWVHGLDEWRPLIDEMPPERAEKITWVPKETIVEAARAFATNTPCMVTGNLGTAQTYNTININRCYAALLALTGSLGMRGGGWNWLHNCRPPLSAGKDLAGLATKAPPISDKLVGWGDISAADYPNAIFTQKPYPIRGVWWNGNMLAQMPGTQKYAAAFKKNVDIAIHNSFHPNFTYHHAHVSFPITSWVEREGLCHHGNNRLMSWFNQCIPENWECRNDIDVIVGLADRILGKDEALRWFPWRREDNPELVDMAAATDWFNMQESFTVGATKKTLDPMRNPKGGVMWPVFTEEEAMKYEFPDAPLRGKYIMYQEGEPYPEDPQGRRFPTPSGKIEIASNALAELGWDYLPRHIEGGHTPASNPEDFRQHPVILCTGRPVSSFHEMGHWWPWADELEPDRYVQIHPDLARVLGIGDGDYVKIESAISELDGYAWVTEEVDPREVWVYCSTDEYQPFTPGLTNRNVSWVIDDIVKDPVYGQPEFKAQLVLVWKKDTDKEEARRKIHEFLEQFPDYPIGDKELGAYVNKVAWSGAPQWDRHTKKVMWQGEAAEDGYALPFSEG
ncbi:MAG: molybdopterin-dependent oxidoreductase [Chloroflexota bacterium]|nr:molybdopterin-dependent oxidoreductase [Chloroflexota bacterium]